MNKAELINAVAVSADVSKKEAEAAAAQEALKNLGYVKVAGADESPVVEGLDAQGDSSPTDGE